jgi:ubiquinone/menaquinone biosynthesis C-methylase UbiE
MLISNAKLNKKDVVEVYSQVVNVYDLWGVLTETRARDRSLVLANISNGESILEVAVGTGLTFRKIINTNPDGENVGIDLTPAMLEKAKQKAARSKRSNYQLMIGDAYDLHFPNGDFDLLMNNYLFDLLPEKDFGTVLQEFKRVLKPGGRLVMVNMTRSDRYYQQFWEKVYRFNPRWLGGCRGVLLTKYVLKAGFKNVQRESLSQFGFPSEILTAVV